MKQMYPHTLKTISELKIFLNCFCGPLKTLWCATCDSLAGNCLFLVY